MHKATLNVTSCDRRKSYRMPRFAAWPHLAHRQLVFRYGRVPAHLQTAEPLSVHAFTQTISRAPAGSFVIDVGSSVGAYAVFAAALGARVLGIEMQPLCTQIALCNLYSNGLLDHADMRLAYVTNESVHGSPTAVRWYSESAGGTSSTSPVSFPSSAGARPIAVPDDECQTMASPTAVAGRYPSGASTRKTRILAGEDNRTHLLNERMSLLRVHPLHLGRTAQAALRRMPGRKLLSSGAPLRGRAAHSLSESVAHVAHGPSRLAPQLQALPLPPPPTTTISIVKIDTEGQEILVLESLRPVWHEVGDVLVEMQPSAWGFAGVSNSRGLSVLRELMTVRGYEAITLEHLNPSDRNSSARIAAWDACDVPPITAEGRSAGLLRTSKGTSLRLGFADLETYVRNALQDPLLFGWFWELLLTSKCVLESADGHQIRNVPSPQ